MALRAKMTDWYNPPRLVETGLRVAISTIFGEFFDRREAVAAARPIDPAAIDPELDYRDRDPGSEFWVDFVADTGDGWNPTYAIARLLAQPALRFDELGQDLPFGDILIMGGDQVYPTASREDYNKKLVAPYDQAANKRPLGEMTPPDVYVIPGNHDWYDGLQAFLGLFCKRQVAGAWASDRIGRMIGGRLTRQTRSYFALALPGNWWIWGLDTQLKGYVDQPQIDFFTHVAKTWMPPQSQLIICTGEPSWAYVDIDQPEAAFKNFSYVTNLAQVAAPEKQHRVRLVLSGDSHHYARYTENDVQYMTVGGGGAFLHPTLQLTDKSFDWDYPAPGQRSAGKRKKYSRSFKIASDSRTGKKSLFPSQKTSFWLAWRNLAFAWLNWPYAVTLSAACGFFAWLLHLNARVLATTLPDMLGPVSSPSFVDSMVAYLRLVIISPWPIAFVLATFGGYRYLADFEGWRRPVAGCLHGVAQVSAVMIASCLIARWVPELPAWGLIAAIAAAGGVLSATLLGVYFLSCLLVFKKHWNEAFSALRIQDYKCFLRMKIAPDGGLTLYPIGLKSVPRDDRRDPPENPELRPHLIETPLSLPALTVPPPAG